MAMALGKKSRVAVAYEVSGRFHATWDHQLVSDQHIFGETINEWISSDLEASTSSTLRILSDLEDLQCKST